MCSIPTFEMLEMDIGRAAHTVTKALDYVGIDDKSHGRRVGLICHRLAHQLGWDQDRRHFILICGMLHDCGVSSTLTHQKLVNEMEWEGADQHCERGEFFLKGFPPFSQYAQSIRYHHTRWENLPKELNGQTKEYANLVFFADRLDVAQAIYTATHGRDELLIHKEDILNELEPYVGTLFAPAFFKAAQKASQRDSFWIELRDEYLDDAIFETLDFADHKMKLSFDKVEALGEMLSMIVDAKSPFTHYHSLRVADLAYVIAGYCGMHEQDRKILRVAGLLHDVGKLRTPDEILEKPKKLSPLEMSRMRCHPMDSKRVLKAIFPNTPIAKWASEHHEKLDGSGYPYGWTENEIDLPTRVLTIADIFQALSQKRPYRERLSVDEVLDIMNKIAQDGQIDSQIYHLVVENKEELYNVSICEGVQGY
ncbi:MAG: HD domain-containing protein [Methylocystaceae bacterium]|nr:HD domain-containing protein [Methylocystaceae bacterium]